MGGFGALRSLIRPLSSTLTSRTSISSSSWVLGGYPPPQSELLFPLSGLLRRQSPWIPLVNHFHGLTDSLTDARFPKRRPSDKPKRKRQSMKPPGPYAWVKYVPGEPILPNNPNEGSVKRRNEKKRMQQKRDFIKSEAKKRKAELQEANRKKRIKRVERKMAAVARDRAWAERLAELQQLEAEKKASIA